MISEVSCVGEQVLRGVEESKADSASQQPWLLITDGKDWHIQNNVFNIQQQQRLHCYYDVGSEVPGLLGRNIGCSYGEWVLLTGSPDSPDVLVNLLSKETIELPLFDFEYDFCILTSPPSDPTCHIVYFNKEENALIICQPGDKEFAIRKWDFEFFPDGVRAVVAGKLILAIPQNRMFLVMVEFKESTYRFEVDQMDSGVLHFLSARLYFFEYSGELFKVYKIMCGKLSFNVAGFKIFKADLLNKRWVRMKNIGRLAIFIGHDETAHVHCAAVESGIAANSVYFLEQDDIDSYYVYNLEEGTIRMKPTFCSTATTEGTEIDWIMMPCDTSFPKLLKGDQESIRQDSEKENNASGEVEEDEVQKSWNVVPPELLNLIQLRLFGRDLAVFRGVCKAWQQISIGDYSIPSLLSSALLEQCHSFSPLLMFQEDRTGFYDSVPVFRFFDPVHKKLYRTGIPELKGAEIHYSRDGWLLVSRCSDQSLFFFNPLTQEKIELPRMPSYRSAYLASLSFSSPPTCSNCLVVGKQHIGTSMFTLKHGEETWREHELEIKIEDARDYACSPLVLNGLHYLLCGNRDMVVFNLKDGAEGQFPDFQIWPSKLQRPPSLRGEDFLVEINGAPAFVSVEPDGGEISIFQWNDLERDWELMEGGVDFGGKEMFLSQRCWFMEKIDDGGGMGNTIFLPMIDDANDGVFYSLATRRYHTFYSGYSSERPYDVVKFLKGIWVKPDRKIVGDR